MLSMSLVCAMRQDTVNRSRRPDGAARTVRGGDDLVWGLRAIAGMGDGGRAGCQGTKKATRRDLD